MKKILIYLLVFAICFSLISCGKTEDKTQETEAAEITDNSKETAEITGDQNESSITPLLYKVTDSDGDNLWLFGSIHVGKEEFYPLPNYVTQAFNESEALAVEFDIVAFEKDLSAQISAMETLVYTDTTTIKDHIPEEIYTRAVEILEEHDIYNPLIDYYIPSVWESLIQNAILLKLKVDTELGIDKHMIDTAYENEKPILDVESAKFQYELMANFSPELQEFLLKDAVEAYDKLDEYGKDLENLIECWSNGDEKGFEKYFEEEAPEDPDELALYEEYSKALITDRNNSMTEYAVEALNEGKELFICVGAAHIVGETGMATQLEELGYTVEVVNSGCVPIS